MTRTPMMLPSRTSSTRSDAAASAGSCRSSKSRTLQSWPSSMASCTQACPTLAVEVIQSEGPRGGSSERTSQAAARACAFSAPAVIRPAPYLERPCAVEAGMHARRCCLPWTIARSWQSRPAPSQRPPLPSPTKYANSRWPAVAKIVKSAGSQTSPRSPSPPARAWCAGSASRRHSPARLLSALAAAAAISTSSLVVLISSAARKWARTCSSVSEPAGWPPSSASIEFDITPRMTH